MAVREVKVTFLDWRGGELSIEIEGPESPISCVRFGENTHHRPFALPTALQGGSPFQLLGYCYGGRAHRLSRQPVDCEKCLEIIADDNRQ